MSLYRTYDHRLKEAIASSGDPDLFPELDIPRSTRLGWIRNGVRDVVSADELDFDRTTLLVELQRLKRERDQAIATQELQGFTFKLFGLQIQYRRLPDADAKSILIRAVQNAANAIGLHVALGAIGLSAARFRAWTKRQVACELADQSSCPRTMPTKLTPAERSALRRYATDPKLAHLSTSALSWLAKRRGELFASVSTWCRIVRARKLRPVLKRHYPARPKHGLRADRPSALWHIDVTVLRLIDQSRVFVQAVIDNASRYVLAHTVAKTHGGLQSRQLLLQALAVARDAGYHHLPLVLCDSGTENDNADVDALVDTDQIQRAFAQIDIVESNSMIEAFFRQLKHRWLFVHPLTTFEVTERLVGRYIGDHNQLIPHHALGGATPAEVFLGTWTSDSSDALKRATEKARQKRMNENRGSLCHACETPSPIPLGG